MAEARQAKLRLIGLKKAFIGETVLDGIDLDVAAGQSLVLIGASGSGKTLILKSIVGLVRPDAGRIELDGENIVGLGRRAREQVLGRMGMLFQQGALFDSLPVWQNIAFQRLQAGEVKAEEAQSLAVERLAAVGLKAEVAGLLPAELSGGMQKRVGVARAIASQPEILLLDEPTAGLDPIMSRVIANLIVSNVRELGATAISVSSDIATATRIGDRIAMLHDGKVTWHGPAAQITASGNEHVDRFIHKWKMEQAQAA